MRGRKHPLEIFRDSGRAFLTKPGDPTGDGSAAPLPREIRGAYLERAREASAERGARRGRGERAAAPVRSDGPAEATDLTAGAGEPAAAPQQGAVTPSRHGWDAKASPPTARMHLAAWSRLPLGRVGASLAAGLVLLVGVAYALSLWPFAPQDAEGDGSPVLKASNSTTSFLPKWLSPHQRDEEREAAAAGEAVGDQAGDGAAVPAPNEAGAAANAEYWVLAASEKLTAATKETWAERCDSDKQRLRKALGPEFPEMRVQSCTAGAEGNVGLLRIGPASTEDDPALVRALTKVRALGDGFAQAYIKKFKKS